MLASRTHLYICEHFDPSIIEGNRYYQVLSSLYIERYYGLNKTNLNKVIHPIVDSSCIGGSPGKKLDQCKFNGYLSFDEICNPCEVKEFQEQCEELCVTTHGPEFGPYKLK